VVRQRRQQQQLLLLLPPQCEAGNASNGAVVMGWLRALDACWLLGVRRSICGGGGDAVEAGVVVMYYCRWVLLPAVGVVASPSVD
jgi:hypothetical protein